MSLEGALARITPCDLVLVEGFKAASIPKLEVYRASVGKPLLHPRDPFIVGIATDGPLSTVLPRFDMDDVAGIASFIERRSQPFQPQST